jgi:hypothetical protein
MGVPIATVRQLAALAATGSVVIWNLTRFENGKRVDAWSVACHGMYRH